jgi:hypothetical protein
VKDQFKYMADFCRSKLTGGQEDARWLEFAAHYDGLARQYAGYGSKPLLRPGQQQQQQQPQPGDGNPEDETSDNNNLQNKNTKNKT